jgi:hypothetical protein
MFSRLERILIGSTELGSARLDDSIYDCLFINVCIQHLEDEIAIVKE